LAQDNINIPRECWQLLTQFPTCLVSVHSICTIRLLQRFRLAVAQRGWHVHL